MRRQEKGPGRSIDSVVRPRVFRVRCGPPRRPNVTLADFLFKLIRTPGRIENDFRNSNATAATSTNTPPHDGP